MILESKLALSRACVYKQLAAVTDNHLSQAEAM